MSIQTDMVTGAAPGCTPDPSDTAPGADRDIVVLFGRCLRLLGQAGHPVAASRLAAQAWWSAKESGDVRAADRINGVMHYLATLPPEPDEHITPEGESNV